MSNTIYHRVNENNFHLLEVSMNLIKLESTGRLNKIPKMPNYKYINFKYVLYVMVKPQYLYSVDKTHISFLITYQNVYHNIIRTNIRLPTRLKIYFKYIFNRGYQANCTISVIL